MSQPESFIRRWSRLKLETSPEPSPARAVAPVLPSADALDFNADFSPFMHPEVDADTRVHALRKLFMSDHYRAMDGLDVYVGDYSRPVLLPAAVLATLDHAQSLLMRPEQPVVDAKPDTEEKT